MELLVQLLPPRLNQSFFRCMYGAHSFFKNNGTPRLGRGDAATGRDAARQDAARRVLLRDLITLSLQGRWAFGEGFISQRLE